MAMLEVNNLSIQFGGLRAVDGFNMTIEKGQLYGLIGLTVPVRQRYSTFSQVYTNQQRESSDWTARTSPEKAPLRSTRPESQEPSRISVFSRICRFLTM